MEKRPESMERITTSALAESFIEEQLAAVRKQVGDKKVLLALSGGVDSSVVAALLIKAIGQNLVCVHVNHGLLRKGEPEQVIEVFRNQNGAAKRLGRGLGFPWCAEGLEDAFSLFFFLHLVAPGLSCGMQDL